MSAVRVKICGITRAEDAILAARLGADALGFNFWPSSRRHCPPDLARSIADRLPPFVIKVGVFVNQPASEIEGAMKASGMQVAQLHGDEPPSLCDELSFPLIKALRVEDASSLRVIGSYHVSSYLVDTPTAGFGGSGRTFDWSLLAGLQESHALILAGGLNAQNVAAAVRSVRPYAVDVASGVERSPGIKDADEMARFIAAAKEA